MVGDTMNVSATDKQDMVGADEGEEFIVERIVSHRMRNGRKEYLLAWKGYPEEENTWVSTVHRSGANMSNRLSRNRTRISIVQI